MGGLRTYRYLLPPYPPPYPSASRPRACSGNRVCRSLSRELARIQGPRSSSARGGESQCCNCNCFGMRVLPLGNIPKTDQGYEPGVLHITTDLQTHPVLTNNTHVQTPPLRSSVPSHLPTRFPQWPHHARFVAMPRSCPHWLLTTFTIFDPPFTILLSLAHSSIHRPLPTPAPDITQHRTLPPARSPPIHRGARSFPRRAFFQAGGLPFLSKHRPIPLGLASAVLPRISPKRQYNPTL